jgi:hypothetical protein
MLLSCRPFDVITFSTGLVSVEVTSTDNSETRYLKVLNGIKHVFIMFRKRNKVTLS